MVSRGVGRISRIGLAGACENSDAKDTDAERAGGKIANHAPVAGAPAKSVRENRQMAIREDQLNGRIATIIRECVNGTQWNVAEENDGTLATSGRRPDILITRPSPEPPIVIEQEGRTAHSTNVTDTRLPTSIRCCGATIISSKVGC